MKDVHGEIIYKDKSYKLVFNLNVMETIQEEYGTIEEWGNLTDGKDESGNETEPNMKAVIFGFREMLNEGIDIDNEENGTDTPLLTHKQVGRLITNIGFEEVAEQLNQTVIASVEDEEKNV